MYKQCIDRSVGDENGFLTQSDHHTAVLVYDSTRQRLNFNALMASSPRRDVVGSLLQAASKKILTLGSRCSTFGAASTPRSFRTRVS